MRPTERLSAATLVQARGALVPEYDRSAVPAIAHIGVGAFARAHLGVYADDLLRNGWPATIRGVSLRGRAAEDQLAPQDGLYTVAEREPDPGAPLRVVGAVTAVGTGPAQAIDAIAAPTTRLVTLTVTEKGYELGPDDLADLGADRPRSAPAVVALGLARRRRSAPPAPVVVSLDNVLHNGAVLRDRVLDVAARLDPQLAAWIGDEVSFPNSVVDRMVPATTPHDLEEIAAALGLTDRAAVTAEHHRSWVITAADGLPPLAEVGVTVVADIAPFERRKLWLLNAPHSTLAYGGLLAGCETIAQAAERPEISAFVRLVVDEILDVADLPPAAEPSAFALEALRRFRNPALGHTCVQVGADGSRKLPQRLLPVVARRREQGLRTERFAIVVAAWIAAASGIPVRGSALPAVEDPAAETLRSAAGGDLRALSSAALGAHCDGHFVVEVAQTLERLVRNGVTMLEDRPW